MPHFTDHAPGTPCWVDLLTSDAEKSIAFYTELFGWTATEPSPDMGGYFNFQRDGENIAGGMGRFPGLEAPDGWTVHLASPDVRASLAAAKENGATITGDAMDVADLGVMSSIQDPAGAHVGIWQPGTHRGFAFAYENNAPAWFELHTTKYDEDIAFYTRLFGWTTKVESDEPHFRYTTVWDGDLQVAGVMDDSSFAPGGPSYWLVYYGVEDADAAAAKARELGGTVTREPETTPYGRLATITDPTGATFNLIAEVTTAVAS